MALVLADRVRETTTTTGTGTVSLAGPVSGFEGFGTAIGNANTTYYTIVDAATGAWEVGLGTYTSAGSTLARTTILSSSNAGSAVNFAAGTKDVFVTQPAERALYLNGAGTGIDAGAASFTANGVVYASSTSALATGSALTFDGTNFGTSGNANLGGAAKATDTLLNFAADTGTQRIYIERGSRSLVFYDVTTAIENYRIAGITGIQTWGVGGTSQMILTSSGLEIKQSQLIGYNSYAGIGTNGLAVAGNVGVGTASPGAKLDVVGSARISGVSGTGYQGLRLFGTGTAYNYMQIDNTGGVINFGLENSTGGSLVAGTSPYATVLSSYSNTPIQFATNNTLRATLNSAGNLGLGTASPNAKLTVGDPTGAAIAIPTTANFYGTSSIASSIGTLGLFSTETAGADVGPVLTFGGKTGNTFSPYPFGFIQGAKESATAGNYAGYLRFLTVPADGGSPVVGMHLSSVGNLGIGTSSPGSKLTVIGAAAKLYVDLSGDNYYDAANHVFRNFAGTEAARISSDGTFRVKGAGTAGSTDAFQVAGTAPADAARITSGGDFAVGRASAIGGARVSAETATGSPTYAAYLPTTGTETAFLFVNPNGTVGSITTNGSATLYNVTSDYRLKTVIGPVADAGQRIDALQPVEYTWNSNGTRTRGFLAHQFQEVYASSVSGTKDAVDAEGKPVYQAMQASTSEVIADLVAEIQDLRKRLAAAGI
jgi:hypothetical protein